ncbi:response regulator [Flavobacterium procerum]|uniref:Response regulator n=1 Tax=Flavobacterium procerum TaxID=1455569 RepID=A0ABV6BT95_9FLAO
MKNIYFADDDPDDREIFAELFYEMFPLARLRLFESGKALMEALSVPSDPLPDLILLDLQMPLKDGFECLKEIRSGRDDMKNIKVIIFSASGNPRTMEHVFSMGADFYALKPVSYGDLKFLIRRVMEIGREDPRAGSDFLLN